MSAARDSDQRNGCIFAALLVTFAGSGLLTWVAVWSGLMHLRGWGFVAAGAMATFGSVIPGYWPYLGADTCIRLWGWPSPWAWAAVVPSQAALVAMIVLMDRSSSSR